MQCGVSVFFFGVSGEGDILNRATVLLCEVPWSPPPDTPGCEPFLFFPHKVLADVRSADLVPPSPGSNARLLG